MIDIARFIVNPLQENCYVVSDQTREAVVVDNGAFYPEEADAVIGYIEKNKLKPVALLATHAHFDHIMGSGSIYRKYGLSLRFSPDDDRLYCDLARQTEMFLGMRPPFQPAPPGLPLRHGDSVGFGTHSISVIATPGHSPGGLCFYLEDEQTLLSGDSLFHHSIGRTDLPDGSSRDLITSLQSRILVLPPQVKVLPGHGEETAIGEEQAHNPYLQPYPHN